MKLIINIPDEAYELLKSKSELDNIAESIIANGTPISTEGDLISRSALKKVFDNLGYLTVTVENIIDNAPTVETDIEVATKDAYMQGYTDGWKERFGEPNEIPQGECKSCIHRDPEDKKCDCGGLERQGCIFPVSDDYFCKFYEKGGAE